MHSGFFGCTVKNKKPFAWCCENKLMKKSPRNNISQDAQKYEKKKKKENTNAFIS